MKTTEREARVPLIGVRHPGEYVMAQGDSHTLRGGMKLDDCLEALSSPAGEATVAVDRAHALFVTASVIAKKPDKVLELGVGSGYLTNSLLQALRFNGKGSLDCVDNLLDWRGRMPSHFQELRAAGANLVIADERDYLLATAADSYDVIMSDANHFAADEYASETLRIARVGGMLFFHDTSNPMFPNLGRITDYVRTLGYYHYEFAAKSRPEERTDRGLLFVIKNR